MDKEKVLNLGLVFEDDVRAKLEKYSQDLSGKLPGPYILGVNSLHITVLRFLDGRTPEEIWSLANRFSETIEIEFCGLYFDQSRESKKLWFGIRVVPSEGFLKLQYELKEAVKPESIVNKQGIKYFPHITLGCCGPIDQLPAISFEPQTTMLENVTCRLALGRSGSNLQFAEILYS